MAQLEYFESLGVERIYGAMALHPPALMKRFDLEGGDAAIKEALANFMRACQHAASVSVQQHRQKPASDPTARRFARASGELTPEPEADPRKLMALIKDLRSEVLEPEETGAMLATAVEEVVKERGGSHTPGAAQAAQGAAMDQICRWQREWFESRGYDHDAAMRTVWSIGEEFKAQPGGLEADTTGVNELLHSFGRLRLAVQQNVSHAVITATKPPEKPVLERRFAPKGAPATLQSSGALTRDVVMSFTQKCIEVLLSEETIALLAKVGLPAWLALHALHAPHAPHALHAPHAPHAPRVHAARAPVRARTPRSRHAARPSPSAPRSKACSSALARAYAYAL